MHDNHEALTPRTFVEVVDDNADLRTLLVRSLQVMGYEARAHASAHEFLDSTPINGPCVMVVDIRMPGMSGLDLHRHLRAQGNDVPVILISGDSDLTDAGEMLSCQRVRFMWKPFSNRQLRESLSWAEQLIAQAPAP